MIDTPRARAHIQPTLLLLGLFVAVSVATRAVVLASDVVTSDEASYFVGAQEILRGNLPYTSFVDNKPPLIYLYFLLSQWLGATSVFGTRLLTTLVTVPLTALAVSAFYAHTRRGVVAAVAFLCVSACFDLENMLAVNCELVMALPLAWSLVALRDAGGGTTARRALLAGVLLGLATLVKYQAGFWLPAILVALAWSSTPADRMRSLRTAATMVGGFALPIAFTAAAFLALGGFEGFFYWNVTHNFGYVLNPTSVTYVAGRVGGRVVPFLLLSAVLWFGAYRSLAGSSSAYWRWLTGGVLLASIAAAALGLRFFAHYFVQLYVPLAIASAPWLEHVLTAPSARGRRVVLGYSAAALVACTGFNAARFVFSTPDIQAVASEVASRLRRSPCYRNGSMFVWGSMPTLYYRAGLPPAARFFFPEFPLVRYYSGNRAATASRRNGLLRDLRVRHWRVLLSDLRESEATFVLDTAPAKISMWEYFPLTDYPMLDRYVERHYQHIDTVRNIRIYQRHLCSGDQLARHTRRRSASAIARP